jgi:pyruvate dehydrogenase E2 component (dihydrolipoamide acetyltransferase)
MATEVVMPAMGLTVEKGIIVKWLKKEGDAVTKGEPIFEVEADKITTEVEASATGILARIIVGEGIEVPITTVVGVITEAGEALGDEYGTAAPAVEAAEAEGAPRAEPATQTPTQAAPVKGDGPVRAVPAARRFAREKGLSLEAIAGSGPDGTILLRDVEGARAGAGPSVKATPLARKVAETEGVALEGVEGTGVQGRIMRADVDRAMTGPAPGPHIGPDIGEVIPMTSMRRVIARRMSESFFGSPHIYFFTDVCMDPLLKLRKDILPDFEERYGIRPSINDFLIKAVALNIVDFPLLNATIKGDEVHILPDVNVCLAVALPDGLIVPAIAHADRVGLEEIARQRKDLVQRALDGKLTMEELERGTFTISSLAQFDINYFTAIINPPQCGILSVGKTRDEISLVEGEVREKKMATLGLGVDHRIIDGAVAADFLQNLKWKLEQPLFTFLTYRAM